MNYNQPSPFSTIKIKGGIVGTDTHVYLDDVELKGVTKITTITEAVEINKVVIEMFANVDIDIETIPVVVIGGKKYSVMPFEEREETV